MLGALSCSSISGSDLVELPTRLVDPSPLAANTVTQTDKGEIVNVSAITEPYNEDRHGRIRLDGAPPETVLRDLRISVGGRDVSPPKLEYAGFGDPSVGQHFVPLRIDQDSDGLIYIYISGGDGGGAHSRRFVVSNLAWIRTEYRDYFTGEYKQAEQDRMRRQTEE